MSTYTTIVGIEVHAELKTQSKMFSGSANNPDEEQPNVNIDPVNMAHPGTLPVINKRAIEHMIKIGLAVNGTVANFTEFDRKNYFYPDIPKGYQISQYKYPIVSGGELAGVLLERIHLEEDTGTSKHGDDGTLLDFNRAGVPLMELVTRPVVYEAEAAGRFARELQLLLRYLGASDANMEKGELRVEANISVLKTDKTPEQLRSWYEQNPDEYMEALGTKVEVKNLNSFKSVERAIAYEHERMVDLIEDGKGDDIVQETRGWDEVGQKTVSQRKKESAHDYRYFPDPDLPKLYLHELFDIESMREALPEIPAQKRSRYADAYGIADDAVEIFIDDVALSEYFEAVIEKLGDTQLAKPASNYLTSDFYGIKKDHPDAKLPSEENFAKLITMIDAGDVNSRGAKDTLLIMTTEGDRDPADIAEEKGFIQKNDPDAIKGIAQSVIDSNPEQAQQYRDGNEKIIKFLMGQVMKESKGSANPQVAEEVLADLLNR